MRYVLLLALLEDVHEVKTKCISLICHALLYVSFHLCIEFGMWRMDKRKEKNRNTIIIE